MILGLIDVELFQQIMDFVKIILFVVDKRSSVDVEKKNKDILILGKDPTKRLDDTTLTTEKKYSISFPKHNKKICSGLHYNGTNNYLFANGLEIIN